VVLAGLIVVLTGAGCGDDSGRRSLPDAAPAVDAAIDVPSPIDAAVDAPRDAPAPRGGYDIGYIDEITFPYNYIGFNGLLLIVNRGELPLNLATTSVVSVTDDQADVIVTFELDTPSIASLQPERAAGALTQNASLKLVSSGLVPEPIDDQSIDFLIGFASFPPIGIDVRAEATLRIGDANIVLPFTLHVVAGDRTGELDHAVRLSSR
jgi:hypothetical protein